MHNSGIKESHYLKLPFFLLAIFLLFSCISQENGTDYLKNTSTRDLNEVIESGALKVVTSYSPVSYFIYRGQPMGYEYELLKYLEKHLEVNIELKIARDFNEMFEMLQSGEVDLIAYNLTITGDRREFLEFTLPLNTTHQVLVQRKPDNWRQLRIHETERLLIRNPIELGGKTVHVRRGSSYHERIINLQNEIGEAIDIVEADTGVTTEELIRMVAEREIDFTVSDENLARLNQAYFPILDVRTELSLPQQTAWAVRKNAPDLLEAINDWLSHFSRQTDFFVIYNKYFENRRAFTRRADSDLMFSTGGNISDFDDIIQKYASELGWDWMLIAAQIFQESQFDPDAVSWAGAMGLMQLMPSTAEAYGAEDPFDPEQNIRAGIRFLQWLDNYWKSRIPDDDERVKFILASYNVGHAHVQDARRLTEYFGADPDVWDDNVARFMNKKSMQEYYTHEVVRFGYARGLEPVMYVQNIMYIYNHYTSVSAIRNLIREPQPLADEP